MEQISSLLNTCFIVALIVDIIFIGISVALFFYYDIKTIFSIRTGKAQAKAVEDMKKANANTGRLKYNRKPAQQKAAKANVSPAPEVTLPQQPVFVPQNNPAQYTGEESTTVLQIGSDETTALMPESDGTEVLTDVQEQQNFIPDDFGRTEMLSDAQSQPPVQNVMNNEQGDIEMLSIDDLHFEVIKKVVSTFTDEVIA